MAAFDPQMQRIGGKNIIMVAYPDGTSKKVRNRNPAKIVIIMIHTKA
jgi:hypothetical protein